MLPYSVTIAAGAAGERLDKALAQALPELSRSRLQALISEGCIKLDLITITDPAQRVKPGQNYFIAVPEAIPAIPEPQNIALEILYEDAELLVINKPAGLVVHPAPGNADRTLVNALLHYCGEDLSGIGGVKRPGIVHRLDKDTSGLMVVAKTDRAHAGLSAQFADRSLGRTYQAVVWGVPVKRSGEISGAIGRDARDRKRMAVVLNGGKAAITCYQVLASYGRLASLVECRLLTGRTHQIRVHMTALGHPLAGDPVYGRRPARGKRQSAAGQEQALRKLVSFPRQALHAGELHFIHPVHGELISVTAPLPLDMELLITILQNTG